MGQVNNFRLVHDKETGRPKGFGFLEFADPDAAASAVRNLNDHDIMGRKLRVDWSNDNGSGAANNKDDNNNMPADYNPNQYQQQSSSLPPLPQGADIPPGLTCPDAISTTLSSIPAPQLLDIISQMKGLVMTDPAQATELLRQAPQLAYAVFQALLLLGLVDTSMLSSIVTSAAAPAPSVPHQPAYVAPPTQQTMPQHQNMYQQGYPSYPPQHQYQQHNQPVHTPPVQQAAYPPPPPQPSASAAIPDQQALLAQVMAMTREQIFALDAGSRDQIVALRAQLGHPV